ncbi:hypothetical protein LQZ18_02430 [Lachnospiraceae bacterium ZAX-1]
MRYSWPNANVGWGNSNWLVLCYKDGGNEYYRLPGFPGSTYSAPSRSSTPIYRFSSANPNGVSQSASAQTASLQAQLFSPTPQELPYELVDDGACLTLEEDELDSATVMPIEVGRENAASFSFRENLVEEVDEEQAEESNAGMIERLGIENNLEDAQVKVMDLVMAEVHEDGAEGEESVIGKIAQYQQQYQGVPIEGNFITICSDNDRVYSVVNRWSNVSELEIASDESVLESEIALNLNCISAPASYISQSNAIAKVNQKLGRTFFQINNVNYIYRQNDDGRYTLHYDLQLENNVEAYVDCKTGEVSIRG